MLDCVQIIKQLRLSFFWFIFAGKAAIIANHIIIKGEGVCEV